MQILKISQTSLRTTNPLDKSARKEISFGYSDKLKTLFKEDKLPTVIYDAFGRELTKKNVTLDHIIPKCKGGLSERQNYMLATDSFNRLRGSRPIKDFLTKENLDRYINQFVDIVVEDFEGNKYIQDIMKTLEKAKELGV